MKPMQSRAWRACVLLSVWAGAVGAAEESLSLRDAIALATQRNPDIAAFSFQAEEARQQAATQALPPSTALEVQLENFAGTGEVSATRAIEMTLQLSHVIELGGKAQRRREVGDEKVAQLDAAQLARRADILAEVARRFVHLLSDQEQLEAAERATGLAEQARNVVQERIRSGAASPVLLSRAEIALARSRIEQEHAEHELLSSRVALASLWGDGEGRIGEARGDLFAFPSIEPLQTYAERLARNPDLLKFAADSRVLDARKRLAEAQRTPNVTVNAGVRRLEGLNDQALVAGFVIPIGTAKRARPEFLSVQAEREQMKLSEQSRTMELKATLFALYQEVLHARTEAQALQNEIRPQAEAMLKTSDAGYRAGRFSFLELADAQQQLLQIERDAIRAAAEFHTNLIEIERVTGVAVHSLAERVTP
jgi:cobalt-zinc-cadmium efflux system outer membrane protein